MHTTHSIANNYESSWQDTPLPCPELMLSSLPKTGLPRQDLVEQLIGNGAHEVDHTLIFDDYTSEELFEILKQMLSDKDFSFEQKAESIMQHYIEYLCSDQYSCYANARTMKIISRTIMQNAYLRLGEAGIKFSRNRITHADVACFEIDERQTLRNRIGFY